MENCIENCTPQSFIESVSNPSNYGAVKEEPRLANRTFVYNLLIGIFSSTTHTTPATLAKDLVRTKGDLFGGVCTDYDAEACGESMGVESRAVGSSSPIREGFRIMSCEEIVEMDESVQIALQRAGLSISLDVNNEILSAIFDLFYPGIDPSEEALGELSKIHLLAQENNQPLLESWRFITLAICKSGGWQVL